MRSERLGSVHSVLVQSIDHPLGLMSPTEHSALAIIRCSTYVAQRTDSTRI
jgi:hypothetical protein